MEFTLKIEMNTPYFQDDPQLQLRYCLGRLFERLDGEVFDKDRAYTVWDSSGNVVGVAAVKVSN